MRSQFEIQFETAADLRISPYSLLPEEKQRSTEHCKEGASLREACHLVPSRSEFLDSSLRARFRATRRATLGSEHDPKRGLGLRAVVARRVSALLVSDLTGVVDGRKGCISPATLLEIGAVADGRIKLRL